MIIRFSGYVNVKSASIGIKIGNMTTESRNYVDLLRKNNYYEGVRKAQLKKPILILMELANMLPVCTQRSKILTVAEVAKILRIHRSTVSRYAMSGELKSYVIGNRRLFKEEDVWAFFENRVDRGYVFGKE